MFAPLRRRQQLVHVLLVPVWSRIVHECFDIGGFGRQTGEVEREPASQGAAIRFRRRFKPRCFQLGQHECVDRVLDPGFRLRIVEGGNRGPGRGDERPVRLVLRPARDPLLERFLLGGRQLLQRLRRRHHFVRVFGTDAFDEFAFLHIPRHDRPGLHRVVPAIDPQIALASGAVRPVTCEAILRENRSNVAVVLELGSDLCRLFLSIDATERRGNGDSQREYATVQKQRGFRSHGERP